MRGYVWPVFFAVFIVPLLPISAPAAQIKECSVAVPSNQQGRWSWRMIDGRKCWYAGNAMISKSSLRWPAEKPLPAVSDATTPASAAAEQPNDPLDAQARLTDDNDSFESRWRARAIHR